MSEEPRPTPAPTPATAVDARSPAGGDATATEAAAAAAIATEAVGATERRFRRAKWIVLLLVGLTVVALDQGSKQWAHTTLRLDHGGRMSVVAGYFDLSYVRNPGAAWGFLARSAESFRHPFFIGISLLAMLFILYLHRRLEPGQVLLLLALSLVLGGAVGNFIDRVRFRFVVDFIELHLRHRHRWPTFNVADMAITGGVILLFAEMFLASWLRRHRRAAATVGAPVAPPPADAARPPAPEEPPEGR